MALAAYDKIEVILESREFIKEQTVKTWMKSERSEKH